MRDGSASWIRIVGFTDGRATKALQDRGQDIFCSRPSNCAWTGLAMATRSAHVQDSHLRMTFAIDHVLRRSDISSRAADGSVALTTSGTLQSDYKAASDPVSRSRKTAACLTW